MSRSSWLTIPAGSHFSLRNIPFGIISDAKDSLKRVGVPIGESVLDLQALGRGGGFALSPEIQQHVAVFSQESLNSFASLGQSFHRSVRLYLQDVLAEDSAPEYARLLRENLELRSKALLPLKNISTHLPMRIGDYTDFFAGIRHAFTVGSLFRGPQNALQPNYKHLPVGYHGRASSVVISGTPLRRPRGQLMPVGATVPIFGPCKRLDIELELAAFVCQENALGTPISAEEAGSFIFGYVLMNDWSARDIQTWEYVPLGPFTAKNFGTTISPWIVLASAMESFSSIGIENDTKILPYLQESRPDNVFDISLAVTLRTKQGQEKVISRSNARNLLWSFQQMIAQHTVSGCNMAVGDLLGSGTISGSEPGTEGSLLELSQGGRVPFSIGDETRTFLEDGDLVEITGWAGDESLGLVGFGECSGQVLACVGG
ncbi:hypothetical protein ANO11243_071330 [Dothideomycetidae sp. 11243]|nr:hypothetical protein ANO11243_071330 [fungal sp. No.11243]